jgi:hypothetical protein
LSCPPRYEYATALRFRRYRSYHGLYHLPDGKEGCVSNRHRQSRAQIPGYEKVSKEARRMEHRRERHAARSMLAVTDPDEVLTPAPALAHTAMVGRAEKPAPAPQTVATEPAPARKRMRHWKTRFWKRRTNLRRQRALAERTLVE